MNELSRVVSSPPQRTYYDGWQGKDETTIRDLLTIASRRRGLVCTVLLATMVIGIALCATRTRLYRATAEVQVQRESADALDLDNMTSQSAADQDAIQSNITLQTEAKILQSDTLALKVIQALDLEHTPDFQPRFSVLGWLLDRMKFLRAETASTAPVEGAGLQTRDVSLFESHLKVKPISGTRLIEVQYLNSNPRTAAAVLNLLVRDLTEFNFETRYGATRQATDWLSSQLSDLQKQNATLQAKASKLQKGSGLFNLGQTDSQGHDLVYTPALEQLQMATTQLADAQSARIMRGALYQVVKSGNPELISALAGNSSLTGSSPGVNGSLVLLQNLRTQEAQTQAQLDEMSAKFGPAYPPIAELEAKLAGIQAAIADEAGRVAQRVRNDYLVAQRVEGKDRAVFQREKQQAESLNDKAVQYEIAQQEAAQSRDLYENLLSRLKEADLVAGLHSSNITVVDPALVPARPAKPNVPIYVAASLFAGFVFAMIAAVLRDATDHRIQELDQLDLPGHEMPVGFLPYHRGLTNKLRLIKRPNLLGTAEPRERIIAAAEPRAAYTEALRTIRTLLMHGSNGEAPPQVILITSSTPGEGKSTLSINLAAVYAQHGKHVLLVDADLRTPTLHTRLGLPDSEGLSEHLSRGHLSDSLPAPELHHVVLDGGNAIDVFPAGCIPQYPAELLGSEAMHAAVEGWRKTYDYILIDGAPLLPVTDSSLLSWHADFTLLVARHRITDRRSLEKARQILQLQNVRHMGVVLNAVRATGASQYRYYGYKPLEYRRGSHVA